MAGSSGGKKYPRPPPPPAPPPKKHLSEEPRPVNENCHVCGKCFEPGGEVIIFGLEVEQKPHTHVTLLKFHYDCFCEVAGVDYGRELSEAADKILEKYNLK